MAIEEALLRRVGERGSVMEHSMIEIGSEEEADGTRIPSNND